MIAALFWLSVKVIAGVLLLILVFMAAKHIRAQ